MTYSVEKFYLKLQSFGIAVHENENMLTIVRKLPDGSISELYTVAGTIRRIEKLIDYLKTNDHSNCIIYKFHPIGIRFFSW